MNATAEVSMLPDTVSADIHVWHARLRATPDVEPCLHAWLTADDRERAARFRRAVDRERYLVAHAILRRLLGWYLAQEPAAVVIQAGDHGKPQVVGSGLPLHFNIAHSGDAALLAFSRRMRVGVDLEQLDRMLDVDGIAARFFAPGEARELRVLPAAERAFAFLRVWVAKEAFAKGIGAGITGLQLRGFEVPVASGWSQVRALAPTIRAVAAGWHVRTLAVPAGCAAALAAACAAEVSRADVTASPDSESATGGDGQFSPTVELYRWTWPEEPGGPADPSRRL